MPYKLRRSIIFPYENKLTRSKLWQCGQRTGLARGNDPWSTNSTAFYLHYQRRVLDIFHKKNQYKREHEELAKQLQPRGVYQDFEHCQSAFFPACNWIRNRWRIQYKLKERVHISTSSMVNCRDETSTSISWATESCSVTHNQVELLGDVIDMIYLSI